MGDVDLFTLTAGGGALTVNAKWLQHLQERLLGEDGHPRKVNLEYNSSARRGQGIHRMPGAGAFEASGRPPARGRRGCNWARPGTYASARSRTLLCRRR